MVETDSYLVHVNSLERLHTDHATTVWEQGTQVADTVVRKGASTPITGPQPFRGLR